MQNLFWKHRRTGQHKITHTKYTQTKRTYRYMYTCMHSVHIVIQTPHIWSCFENKLVNFKAQVNPMLLVHSYIFPTCGSVYMYMYIHRTPLIRINWKIVDIHVWQISGVDGQVINNQGYQSHWGCQSYLTRDTRGKWIKQREVSTPYKWNGYVVVVISSLRL